MTNDKLLTITRRPSFAISKFRVARAFSSYAQAGGHHLWGCPTREKEVQMGAAYQPLEGVV